MTDLAHQINATFRPNKSLIAPGDKLEVRFAYAAEWLQEGVTVQDDGRASFLGLVDELYVAGLTTEQLDERLTQAYETVLPNNDLTISLTKAAPLRISVIGEVGQPGFLEIPRDRPLSLLDTIALAGGFHKQSAYLGNVLLVRWDPESQKRLSWVIDARQRHWGGETPIYLQPYDIVYIPNTPIDKAGIIVENWIRRMIPFPYLLPTSAFISN